MNRFFIVGLTGQSGAGKTTVSRLFEESGFAVINCDLVARKVTESGSDCCKELSITFPECFDESFTLDRRKMAEIVFSNKDKLEKLNSTIFPFISRYIECQIADLCESGARIIVLDAPTLFESGIDKRCDMIVSVIADEEIRAKRISERDKIPEELIRKRFESQLSQDYFIGHSDFTIENNTDLNAVVSETYGVINKIKEIADVPYETD